MDQKHLGFLQSAKLFYNKKSATESGGSGGEAGVGGAVIISTHPVSFFAIDGFIKSSVRAIHELPLRFSV